MSSRLRIRCTGLGVVTALAATLTMGVSAFADHCNSYRGPAGQVPPTGRTPNDPTPPTGPGGGVTGGGTGGGSTTPSPVPGVTGGGPAGPRGGATPRGATPGRGRGRTSGAEGFERWEFWWEYNKDALLNLRARLSERETASGSSDFFLGSADKANTVNVTRPTERLVKESVIPALITATGDKYYLVRDAAVLSLGKIGDPSALPTLVKMLKDEHREVQESAALSLGLLGNKEALPILVALMKDNDESHTITGRREILTRTRGFATVGLGLLGDEQAVPALLSMLDTNEPQKDVQVCAAVALGILKSTDAVEKLISIVKDEQADEFLRAYAATSLGKIGDARAIPVLENALRDKNLHVSRSAVMSLSLFNGDAVAKVVDSIIEVAEKGRDAQAKNWAMITLGRIGGSAAKKTLMAAVEGEQRSTQAFAALGLALFGMKTPDAGITDVLRKSIEDVKDPSVKGAFAIALGLLQDKSSETLLTDIVKSPGTADLRGYSAIALGLMRARNSTPTIEAIVKETTEPTLQRSGAMALGLMGDRNVVTLISTILKTTSNTEVMSSAATALGTIGDHTAIDPLLEAMNPQSKLTDTARAYAASAIGILGEPTDVPKMSLIARDLNYRAQIDAVKTLLNLL
jgi:HEAT repeat protein